ncbi:hypothetical protein AFLA_006995 [Aspergillus flavus NRRL3357]|nr:hypothetical protein AFLA_006995 [Aspergillus flavus NRRL3357]
MEAFFRKYSRFPIHPLGRDYASVNPPITGFALTQWRASRLVVSPRQWRYLTTYVQGIRHQRKPTLTLFHIDKDAKSLISSWVMLTAKTRHRYSPGSELNPITDGPQWFCGDQQYTVSTPRPGMQLHA